MEKEFASGTYAIINDGASVSDFAVDNETTKFIVTADSIQSELELENMMKGMPYFSINPLSDKSYKIWAKTVTNANICAKYCKENIKGSVIANLYPFEGSKIMQGFECTLIYFTGESSGNGYIQFSSEEEADYRYHQTLRTVHLQNIQKKAEAPTRVYFTNYSNKFDEFEMESQIDQRNLSQGISNFMCEKIVIFRPQKTYPLSFDDDLKTLSFYLESTLGSVEFVENPSISEIKECL